MSEPARPLPSTLPPLRRTAPPFFDTLDELWRWQLEQIGDPSTWTADERTELEPFYRVLRARLGLAE